MNPIELLKVIRDRYASSHYPLNALVFGAKSGQKSVGDLIRETIKEAEGPVYELDIDYKTITKDNLDAAHRLRDYIGALDVIECSHGNATIESPVPGPKILSIPETWLKEIRKIDAQEKEIEKLRIKIKHVIYKAEFVVNDPDTKVAHQSFCQSILKVLR